ncbi:DUF3089 domain-containing protein [Brachyspira murdochii]|uniref:DUF3089 domain-containing protein n=2 Tax=Brachyspira murdochii TaxID=84378 RepID=D5U3Y5_BRAM5|nr:DUF3089 domain-containing protein [Brachyspira murdochii]ADG70152.1 conserved hypothetical protein [Brachyspira murdochii DSM 12563]PPS21086.1 hypothetical protein DJ52_13070 [Brachyspira murdochii]
MIKIKLSIISLITILILACSQNNNENVKANNNYYLENIDYSDSNNWLNLPNNNNGNIDIFYLYPTTWASDDSNFMICPIDYTPMRATVTNKVIMHTSMFEEYGNVYAPFYRQANALYLLNQTNNISKEELNSYLFSTPKDDAIAAFDYFIKNYNNNRPIILMGHSQGAMMIKEILKDYFKDNEYLQKRLIAAYIIGYSVTKEDIEENPHLKFASGEYDTGVIISYNTESPDFNGYNPTLLENSITINPITWTLEETLAAKELSLGANITNENTLINQITNFSDAKVDKVRGVIKCSTADTNIFFTDRAGVFSKGIFHAWDIELYYFDLKANAKKRVEAFMKQNY